MGNLVIATHKELTEMITSLRAENEKLRAALKPFAECDPIGHDDWVFMYGLKIGDLRAARAALKEMGDE